MGIKLFRDSNWLWPEERVYEYHDIKGLDRVKDRELIDFLLLHFREGFQSRVMRKYRITEIPEEHINVDDPDDETYRTYFVLREQVAREEDYEVLREVAFANSGSAGKFAFCRLTGFSWPSSECDAYSYRTFCCGLKSDVMREDIEAFCREMIEKDGPFSFEAKEWLAKLPEISDAELDEWASGDTERKETHPNPAVELQGIFRSQYHRTRLCDEEVEELIRVAYDAFILTLYEEKYGTIPRRERREITDQYCRRVNEVMKNLNRDMINGPVDAAKAILFISGYMREEFTDEIIKEIAESESPTRPQHSRFLELAKKVR